MTDLPAHSAYGQPRRINPYAEVVLAPNPSAMTLEGTNSWILGRGNARVVVDPGPDDDQHLELLTRRGDVELILLTHFHHDHTDGARRLAELTGAPIRAADSALCHGEPLRDGEVITAAGMRLRVLATPGHTADSVCLVFDDERCPFVLTGDTILGRGTTVIAHPHGDLGAYLDSLRALAALPEGMAALAGHGPERPDVVTAAIAYLDHRLQRLDQIRGVIRQLGTVDSVKVDDVVQHVYPDVDSALRPAVEQSVRAQLDYLRG